MSDNWVVQHLINTLDTWNEKLAEVWRLLTISPANFKGGGIWNVILQINGSLQAIGLALLVLFFLAGVVKTSANLGEIKRPEHALKLFLRFAIAKGVVTYGLDLMMSIFAIIQGVVSKIMTTSGVAGAAKTTLPEEMIDAIEDCGFFDSIPLKELREYRTELMNYIRSYGQDIIEEIETGKVLNDDLNERIERIITAFEE